MIPGWAMPCSVWLEFAQYLTRDYQVICIDLPGQGESEAIFPFTLHKLTDALANTLEDKTTSLMGWSLGATVAMAFAERFPERVERLILLAGNPHFTQASDWAGVPDSVLRQFAENLDVNSEATLVRFLSLMVNHQKGAKNLLKILKNNLFNYPLPTVDILQAGLRLLQETDLRAWMASTDIPVTSILGGLDALVPVELANHFKQSYPHSTTHVIDQAGHVPFLSHSEQLLTLIREAMES